MTGKHTFWTDERMATCNEMLLAGSSYQAIADVIGEGATRNAVAGYVKRDQPPRPERPVSKADDQPVKRKYTKRHNDGERPEPTPMPEPVGGGVATIDLTPRQCRFVLSAETPWTHCGQQTQFGTAWCKFHRAAVYQPQRAAKVAA